MNEYELIAYMLVLSGVAWTSYKIGTTEGIQDAIRYFHEKGVIELDDED